MSLSLFAYRAASEFLEACPSEMIINAVVSVYWATHLFLKVMRPVNASGRMYQQIFHQDAMKYIESIAHICDGITP